MTDFTIRRFHFLSAGKFGCLAGIIIMALPAFACSLVTINAANTLLDWILSVSTLDLGLLGSFNLLQILNLTSFVASLQRLSDSGWLFVLGVTVVVTGAGAVWIAVIALLSALLYNVVAAFSGGLSFTAETPDLRRGQTTQAMGATGAAVVPAALVAVGWLVSSANPKNRWPIQAGRTTFGSAAGNNHVIKGLAGRQAEIHADSGRCAFYDRSDGQSWINGAPVGQGVWLKPGDNIRLGSYDFVFEAQPAAS